MDGSVFQVDIILNSLKELQNGWNNSPSLESSCNKIYFISPEKGRNERVLAEEYGRRKELEAQLEEATSKHTVASERNAKMREAMNVAEMKVAQIQDQVKMYIIIMKNICCTVYGSPINFFR